MRAGSAGASNYGVVGVAPTQAPPYYDPPRQVAMASATGNRPARAGYPSSPTTAELWAGSKPLGSQSSIGSNASRSNIRSAPPGLQVRPLGVIPPLSNAVPAPERPQSNTSLSSSDSAPGSIVSSRSSSRDPLPSISTSLSPVAMPTPPFNGQPPQPKPPYGTQNLINSAVPQPVSLSGSDLSSDTPKTSPVLR